MADENAQGRWYELLSPTQVLTGDNEEAVPKTTTEENRTSTSQRHNACQEEAANKDHNEGSSSSMDQDVDETASQNSTDSEEEEELSMHESSNRSQSCTTATNKRKRDVLSDDDQSGPLQQSLSQLSISQENVTKQSKCDVIGVDSEDERSLNEMIRTHVPSYLKTPDHVFVRMLAKTIEKGHRIIEWLDTEEKIAFIRQMARVTDELRYFELQRLFWQDHYDLGLKEGWWGMELAKSYAKEHRVCRAYSFTKDIIEEQQLMARNKLQRNVEVSQKYLLQLGTNARQWQPSIDPHLLTYAVDAFVQCGQKRLREEFDYKKKMLTINATDHYLIRSFYWFKPNPDQIDLAKKIWQTTADAFQTKQREEILRERIARRRWPHQMNRKTDQTMTELEALLKTSIMDEERRASLAAACSKLATQYKFDMLSLHLQAMQDIRRAYQEILSTSLKELSETDWPDSVKCDILDRQDKIVERYELRLKYKLRHFSVEDTIMER